MYRDNSLMPKEAVRLAALGTLAQAGSLRYADLAGAIRHFTSRIVGPSLDLMGTSLELLRYDGLIEALDGTGMEDNAVLTVTEAGRKEFVTLMRANVRAPSSDDINKLVITLKLRFLHLLDQEDRREQADALASLYETELARLQDLRRHHDGDSGHLVDWLDHDISQVEARLRWFQDLYERV
jgi:DNA-binding PadR family transcriptional regulator